ncbi:MAG: tetratricopeptide repeat protein [Aquificaceae bacterium]|nr:tetratricopeptide repeat protein [Aquificaceae bacterium]
MMDKGYKGIFSKMGEGLLEKFIEDLKRELQERPEDSELLFKLGVAYSRAGKVEEAREVYKKLREIDKEKAKELLDIIYGV